MPINPKVKPLKTKSNLPNSITILFLVLFILFGFLAIKDSNLKLTAINLPILKDVIALVNNTTANTTFSPTILEAMKSNQKIVENSYERSKIINPLNKSNPIQKVSSTGATLDLQTKGGINNGFVIGSEGGVIDFIQKNSLDMSYILGMATTANIGGTVNFIKASSKAGLLPIVRLCYPDNCAFHDVATIVSFYKAVNDQLSGDEIFIGVVGPNEPGTAGEGATFLTGSSNGSLNYQQLVNISIAAADQLQDIRASNGNGHMYIAPAIFNMSNTQNDDVKAYLYSSPKIDPLKFDYILGNTYDVGGQTAPHFYDESGRSIKQFVLNANQNGADLLTIVTEFGFFPNSNNGPSPSAANAIAFNISKDSYNTLCNDDTVDGILFFRPFYPELAAPSPRQEPPYTSSLVKDFIDGCAKTPIRFHKRTSWANWYTPVNIYKQKDTDNISFIGSNSPGGTVNFTSDPGYHADAMAKPFYNQDDKPVDYYGNIKNGAGLLVKCNGGNCSTVSQNTLFVEAPIKSYSSNSPYGTRNKAYVPICPSVSSNFGINSLDPLQMFASPIITDDGKVYPIPQLGSAINCGSQLIKTSVDLARFIDPIYTKAGALSDWGIKRTQLDTNNKQAQLIKGSIAGNYGINGSISDQKATCIVDKISKNTDLCVDTGSTQQIIQGARVYNPYSLNTSFYTPLKTSNPNNMIFQYDKQDYIPGPELTTSTPSTEWSGTQGDICKYYAQRSSQPSKNPFVKFNTPIKCELNQNEYIDQTQNLTCRNYAYDVKDCLANDSAKFKQGLCNISEVDKKCFQYDATADDKVYIYTNSYSPIPTFNIPNVFDSLYNQYRLIESQLSRRNRKIMFNENIGKRFNLFSVKRDMNSSGDYGPNLYLLASKPLDSSNIKLNDTQYLKLNGSIQSQAPDNFIDNSHTRAIGNSYKENYQYYDWLGYLDYFQELNTIYSDNTTLSAEQLVDNPFYKGKDATAQALKNTLKVDDISAKAKILVADVISASHYLSSPLLTQDQISICKKYTNSELKVNFLPNEADLYCPLDKKLTNDVHLNYITTLDGNVGSSLFENEMCKRGYQIDGVCAPTSPVCNVITSYPVTTTTPPSNPGTPPPGVPLLDVPLQLALPFKGSASITNGYNNLVNGGYHAGVDYRVPNGTAIFTSAAGKVTQAEYNCSYNTYGQGVGATCAAGNYVKIIHYIKDPGADIKTPVGNFPGTKIIWTEYQHLQIPAVKVGDIVQQGQLIGYSDNTGNSTGSHLHWEGRHRDCGSDEYAPTPAGTCTFDPTQYEIGNTSTDPGTPPLYQCTDIDLNGKPITDIKSTKNYSNLDCLIKDESEFVGIPPALQKAIMILESGWFINDQTSQPYTGDPSQISRTKENPDGAMGPLQITRGSWNRVALNNNLNKVLTDCIAKVGLTNFGALSLDQRAVLGISLCSNSIFLKYAVEKHMNTSYIGHGSLLAAVIAEVTDQLGPDYAILDKNYLAQGWNDMTAKIAAYHQLGICKTPFSLKLPDGSSKTSDYCEFIDKWYQKYTTDFTNLKCTN